IEAEELLSRAIDAAGSHVHLRAAALDAMSQLFLSKGDVRRARELFLVLLNLRRGGIRGVTTRWDGLSELFTRARILEAEGRRRRAVHLLRAGVSRAASGGERFWELKLALHLARVAAELGEAEDAKGQLISLLGRPLEGPEMVADLCLARAAA